ncbi:MAG: hypothetical protein UC961_03120, partial [Emergencia sp.]|nr:hypothetical protein [Emergencia sp.]
SFAAAEVLKLFQFFVPFFNSWWLILAFSEYIEGRGNELYYIAGRMKSGLAVLWTTIHFPVLLCTLKMLKSTTKN